MSNPQPQVVSFNINKSMIKLVQDADNGIVPKEGDTTDGEVWVKGQGKLSI